MSRNHRIAVSGFLLAVAAWAPVTGGVSDPAPGVEPVQASEPLPDPGPAHLVGRLLLPSGDPASGARVRVRAWQANQARVLEHGLPENWQDPAGITDADGRFDLVFDPPPAFQFVLEAELRSLASMSWRWGSLARGAVTDVGEQTLAVPGTISGRVVRLDGRPAEGLWVVYAESSYRATGETADATSMHVVADRDTGAFRLEDVPPGSVKLTARLQVGGPQIGETYVTLAPGGEAMADLVYSGPDLQRTIRVLPFSRPYSMFGDPSPGAITCTGPDGRIRTAARARPGSTPSPFASSRAASPSFGSTCPPSETSERERRIAASQRTGLARPPASAVSKGLIAHGSPAAIAGCSSPCPHPRSASRSGPDRATSRRR